MAKSAPGKWLIQLQPLCYVQLIPSHLEMDQPTGFDCCFLLQFCFVPPTSDIKFFNHPPLMLS